MKKIYSITALTLMLLCSTAAMAERVTLGKAKSIAAQFMKTASGPQLVKRQATATTDEDNDSVQNIYIFSRGEGQGFVIVSGDDALPQIIGYSEAGDYDEDDLPPALQDMIEYYAQAADVLQADTTLTITTTTERKQASSTDIATLMTSHWHQSWPYYNLCPYITGTTNRAATGCVATASSQIIYYWRADLGDRTLYDTPTYSYGDAPVTESIPSGTPLKWDLMQDSYSGSDPDECTTAVATLVAVVGASGWLTYGSSTSGQISNMPAVFSGQFGLNGGSTVWKSSYSQSTWESMIIQDLEAGRPILYSGVNSSSGGHAVVIDGYQASTGLFHFNFGWGSGNGYDGYYTVDDTDGMNGFNESQGMVWNIYPKSTNIAGSLEMERDYFISRVANTITAKVSNDGTLAQSGFYVYCLSGTNTPSTASSATDSDTETVIASGETATMTFSFTPSGTLTYTIYLTDANKNILAKITDVETVASTADLTLNSMGIDDGGTSETLSTTDGDVEVLHVYNSKKANVTANFTNGEDGTLCTPSVKGIVYQYSDGAWTQSTTKTKKNVTFEEGETADMVFDLSGLTDDVNYMFKLDGTASTNKSFDITYATPDTCIYFKLVGSNLEGTTSEDGAEMAVTGNYNATVFASLAADTTVSRYDMTAVTGITTPLEAGNKNALFYLDASQGISGTNIVVDQVCEALELTPGYNFQPREDFVAMTATYHATQSTGYYATAILPFDAETPSGMFARKVNALKTSYLQDVDSCNLDMKGGTPYIILTGEPIDITAQNANVSTGTESLGTDSLRGTWVNMVATDTQYVLDDADTQYFNSCTGEVIPALTAYLEYTRKVRSTSASYATKDKKARALAEQIKSALETYEAYLSLTTESAQKTFMAAIDEARDTLRTQPLTSYQTAQVNALEDAAEAYIGSVTVTADNGLTDMTDLVTNPSFELGSTKGWTVSDASVSNISSSLANYMSGADGTYVVNASAGGSVQQTLTGVENGVYQLVVSVGADYDQEITVFAGTDSVTVTATDFGPMYLEDATVDSVVVTDGTLTIGVLTVADWVKADNFRLYQISGDTTPVTAIKAEGAATAQKGIYDLTGRRLQAVTRKGIYIIDGKKTIKE